MVFFNAVGKFRFRQPAQFLVNLGRVDGVTAIVALAVGYMLNQTSSFPSSRQIKVTMSMFFISLWPPTL